MYVLLGAIVGVIGFVPLIFSLRACRRVTPKSNFGYGAVLILGVVASFIILFVSVLLCYLFARDDLVAFVLAAAITLVVVAIAFGIYSAVKRDKAAKARKNKNKKDK